MEKKKKIIWSFNYKFVEKDKDFLKLLIEKNFVY